ncbi:Uncharacterised protein [Mycobacteroides abscessus subsp. abscessus]|nr:Uncharacterised protein [Mycobacteroides abscessus subsp. abscessus]
MLTVSQVNGYSIRMIHDSVFYSEFNVKAGFLCQAQGLRNPFIECVEVEKPAYNGHICSMPFICFGE